jgi:hypothetical protein
MDFLKKGVEAAKKAGNKAVTQFKEVCVYICVCMYVCVCKFVCAE